LNAPARAPRPLLRRILIIATSAAGAGAMLYMQGRFDRGDRESALALARNYRSPSGRSLPELIAAEHPGAEPQWTARTESSCFGHERVRADVTTAEGGHTAYEFLIDINGPSIHPGSPSGERIVTELNR
jgi:hypothetical protein